MIFLINWVITSFINGLIFFLIFAFLLYWFYLKELPKNPPPVYPQFEEFALSNAMREMLKTNKEELSNDTESMIALNLMLQFLFQELKDTKSIRRYIIRKLSVEFKELLTTKGAGKIVERLTAKDFSLGSSCPVFHSIKLSSLNMDSEDKSIQELSIIVDLEYQNGFSISIDADLIWGKSAYIHVKIVSLKGKARLQFTRHPFTHWNFAFIEDPAIQFATGWKFDGLQIPRLTELIETQLRRSLRRKHTLPNYKVRFKPFFEPLYDQSLYKSHIDEILLKNASRIEEDDDETTRTKKTGEDGAPNGGETDEKIDQAITKAASESKGGSKKKNAKMDLAARLKIDKSANKSFRYRKLCEKMGMDLTTVGRLNVSLKMCDRLPEALYSINILTPGFVQQTSTQQQQQQQANNQNNQLASASLQQVNPAGKEPIVQSTVNQASQMNRSQSSQTLSSQVSQELSQCLIYITASVDAVSMKNLMAKQICKEHWPSIEFEIVRSVSNQPLGINFMEVFFINRPEVTIQNITPNSLASQVPNLKMFDIVYSLNQVRISSLKQLSKIVQKSGTAPLRFVVQRPCILFNNPVMVSTASTVPAPTPTPTPTPTPSNNANNRVSNPPQQLQNTEEEREVVQETTTTTTNATNNNPTTIVEETAASLQNPQTSLLLVQQQQQQQTPIQTTPTVATNANTVQTTNPTQATSTASALVSSTRSKFERFEKKIKSSFGGFSPAAHNNSQITAAYTTPTTTSYSTSSTNVVTSLSTNMPKSSSQGNLSTASQTPITVPSQSSQLQQQQEPMEAAKEAAKEQLVLSVSTMSTVTAAPSPNTLAVNGGPTSTTTAPKLSPNQTVAGAISVAASPSLPLITHTASASNLVEFFCNVSESKMGDDITVLDLMSLLVNSNTPNCESQTTTTSTSENDDKKTNTTMRKNFYFKKSKEIRLEKENLLYSFNNKPIAVNETYGFDLNANTNYLNMFLWTVQFLNKGTRKRNLLLGYISIPLNEITVDCWNTSKGETQTMFHFHPIEEFKATAAIGRLTRSHVISDHPGFDPNLTMGTITLNIRHSLTSPNSGGEKTSSGSDTSSAETPQANDETKALITETAVSSSDQDKVVANTIADVLVEQKKAEVDLESRHPTGLLTNFEDVEDDGTTHKFMNITFTETVSCQSCNKKIWLKNALQCAYCGLVIHLKCYDKTIEKSVCNRFNMMKRGGANDKSINGGSEFLQPITGDESFQEIHSHELSADSNSLATQSQSSMSGVSSQSSRNLVSNLFNTIRQRRVPATNSTTLTATASYTPNNNNSEKDNVSIGSNSSSTSSYFKSKYLSDGLNSISFGKSVSAASKTVKMKFRSNKNPSPTSSPSTKTNNTDRMNAKEPSPDDDISLDASEEFKDMENDEKLYGTELFNELPSDERKMKFEENINKYRSSIDEMTKMREELNRELELLLQQTDSSSSKQQQEQQIRSQIKHISDQIKCVGFLLMQAQLGFESLNEEMNETRRRASVNIPLQSDSVNLDGEEIEIDRKDDENNNSDPQQPQQLPELVVSCHDEVKT